MKRLLLILSVIIPFTSLSYADDTLPYVIYSREDTVMMYPALADRRWLSSRGKQLANSSTEVTVKLETVCYSNGAAELFITAQGGALSFETLFTSKKYSEIYLQLLEEAEQLCFIVWKHVYLERGNYL